ncbi:MAG TPA: hypothetical protein VM370_11160 [Candidatus Thermoplasmatota archaeon]|nr:hypothetical protein [Candidatus Thermoplasmatota archaeon]
MRQTLHGIAICIAAALLVYGAEAFSGADTGTRDVTATVVGDSAAYLSLAARAGPWAQYVAEDATTGLVSVSFAGPYSGGPAGAGVNPKSTYYFDDILQLTNQGNATIYVQAVGSSVRLCYAASVGAMTNACYAATNPTTATALAVGATAYLGIGVDSSAIASKAAGPNAGTFRVYACRTAAASCASG